MFNSCRPVFLSMHLFLPESTPKQACRVGLEVEYARGVLGKDLKYELLVGKASLDGKPFALLKLDGISEDKEIAILELECRPFPIDSKEFAIQLSLIEEIRKTVLNADNGSSVKTLAKGLGFEEEPIDLSFDKLSGKIGPFCQVTVELPLSRMGDPKDTAILELVQKPTERELLVYARTVAEQIVEKFRPIASELQGNLYDAKSIKLAKMRGYWTQTIMQACQKIHYGTDKERVGFHIRAAGPFQLSARDKIVLKAFSFRESFREFLTQVLEKGAQILAKDGRKPSEEGGISSLALMIMKDSYDFEPRVIQFKSGGVSNLEFAYGMTLVELRHVRSSLNQGVMIGDAEAISLIKKAQTKSSGPKKVLL
jgi:hypothetical protein